MQYYEWSECLSQAHLPLPNITDIKEFRASTASYLDGESVLPLPPFLGAIACASAASMNYDFSSEFAWYIFPITCRKFASNRIATMPQS